MQRTIFFGPPGTGKTTTLLGKLEEALTQGVPPQSIAFLTFTRRARREALERVEKVLGIEAKDLPHFRTIHSMAFKGLGLKEGDVLGRKELDRFGLGMGLKFGASSASEVAAEGINSQEQGDALLALDNLARLRGNNIERTWKDARSDIDWHTVDHFSRSYAQYKRDTGLLDFTDVLAEFAKSRKELDVDVAFVDEAQDLSALQWLAALQAITRAQQQYIAGDDDQAIYRWAGAEVEVFLNLPGERQVLKQSYRLPSVIHAAALKLSSRITNRVEKIFEPRAIGGAIKHHATVESLKVRHEEQWLWLVRNRYLLPSLRERLERQDIVYSEHGQSSIYAIDVDCIYTWERLRKGTAVRGDAARALYKKLATKVQIKHGYKTLPNVGDAQMLTLSELQEHHGLLVSAQPTWYEALQSISHQRRSYYRALLRAHGTLKLQPQVQLETIHGSKGTEAPHVALFLEQSRRVWEGAVRNPDEEHRVFYVGMTRAREVLHVVQGNSPWSYPFPR